MAANPLESLAVGAALWLVGATTLSERHVRLAARVQTQDQNASVEPAPTDVPKLSLEVFDGGGTIVVVLNNTGAPDEFKGEGQIVRASRGDPRTHPFILSWDNLLRAEKIRHGHSGRVTIARREYVSGKYRLNISGDHTTIATWSLGLPANPTPVTVIVRLTFAALSFQSAVIIRHYQIEANPDSKLRVTSWVPF